MSYSLAFSQSIFMMIYVGNKVEMGEYEFTPTQKLSQELNIPPSTAAMILRRLNRAGLIETREGVNGGVRLALPPDQITLLDLFSALEQQRSMFVTNVTFSVSGEKTDRIRKAVKEKLEAAEDAMKESLKTVTIRDLMHAGHG